MEDTADIYYFRTAADGTIYPSLEGPVDTEVCVIGGGLAGLAVAAGLIERGKQVVLLEGNCVGYGASGRNGGFALAGYAAGAQAIIKKVGVNHARSLFNLTREAQRIIRRRARDYNISCAITYGHLRVSWFANDDEIRRGVDFMNDNFDLGVGFWDRDRVQDVCRTDRYYAGQFYPDYFHMQPLDYLKGLARVVVGRGGRIFENSAALSLEKSGAGTLVATAKGSVRADQVVICGSAYFNALVPKLSRACLPVSTYVMVTKPIDPEILGAVITKPYAIRDTRWADDYYRILPDGRILWGGRVGLGRMVPQNLDRLMLEDLFKIYPQLRGHVECDTAWAGVMGYTVHKMPHIGQLRPGLWYCTNFGGNGVAPTTAGGEVIAAAIAENDETYKLFAPFGFAWTGGALGPLVAQAVYHGWEWRDRFFELSRGVRGAFFSS